MSETWYQTASPATRWDTFTSAMSDPVADLINAVGSTKARMVTIPRRAWDALRIHPTTRHRYSDRPLRRRILWGLVEWDAREPLIARLSRDLRAKIEIVDEDGPVRVGDFELRGVVEEVAR